MQHITNKQSGAGDEFIFPDKLSPLDKTIEIKPPKPVGLTANVYLHEIARKLESYNYRIYCIAEGEDKDGNKIKINSLGRWVFGVPGFQGHLRIVPQKETVLLYYPDKSPEIVDDFLKELKHTVENNHKI